MPGNQHNDWGKSDIGKDQPAEPSTQNQQGGGAGNGASSSGINTNFQHADPESNVNPAGAPQNSHGSATGPLPGGVEGQYQASQSAIAGNRQAATLDEDDDRMDGAGPAASAP